MHILIAPNAFKNSLSASAVADAISRGLRESKLHCSSECFPAGDGGDGTAALIVKKLDGVFIPVEVHDPLGKKIKTSFGLTDNGNTAVIEMADASGLRLLKPGELDPWHASSMGTGELIKRALDKGVNRIILCIGGSATVDGGCGILQALGARFIDDRGKILSAIPESLVELAEIDTSSLDKRIFTVELIVLCDVENTLLGENGAAAVFGPQKGATAEDIRKLEQVLGRLQDIALLQTGKDMAVIKHGGAAGGVAAGLHVFLGARLVNGIDYFLDITGFDEALQKADLLITGEGSIDIQTLQGKGPFGVARRAKNKNIPVIAFAGKVPLEPDAALMQYFDVLLSIGNEPVEISTALQNTRDDLIRTATQTGNLLALKQIV